MVLSFADARFEDGKAGRLGVTVRNLIFNICPTLDRLSVVDAVLLGFALGLALGVGPDVLFGWPIMIPGFLVYFPFHVWLCYVAFGVLFSSSLRDELMGEGYSPIGAFFGYFLTTRYGLFCLTWLSTMWLYWVSVTGV